MRFHGDRWIDLEVRPLVLALDLAALSDGLMTFASDDDLGLAVGKSAAWVRWGLAVLEAVGHVWILEPEETGWPDRAIVIILHPLVWPFLSRFPPATPTSAPEVRAEVLRELRIATGIDRRPDGRRI